jgi:hypothetical protein
MKGHNRKATRHDRGKKEDVHVKKGNQSVNEKEK